MINKITRALVEGNICEKCYQKIKKVINKILKGVYRKKLFKAIDVCIGIVVRAITMRNIEVQNNKIMFLTFQGKYLCNPKYIADEILRRNLPWELVWVYREEALSELEQFPSKIKLVRRESKEFYEEALSSKIWIDNAINTTHLYLKKKKNQILIETWHGSLGLKRFETNSNKRWIYKAKKIGSMTDYCISNSDFETNLYRNTFWKNSEIWEYGHARNDVLLIGHLGNKENVAKKIKQQFGLENDVKFALYAPTFRNDKNLKYYDLNYLELKRVLEEKFGGHWVILSRLHYQCRKLMKKNKAILPENVYDVTDYPDIQELMLVSDVGITDYSSWICDYVLTRKPGFIFAIDKDEYVSERGFYFPLEETPFPVAVSNSELFKNILNFDNELYQNAIDVFLEEKGCIDDGNASERIVDKLEEIMKIK